MFDEEAFPDGRSLKFLTDRELHAPDIVDRICEWWSCSPEVALKAKGSELRRRTQTTERPRNV